MTFDIGVHLQTQDGQTCALWVNYSGSVTRLVRSVAPGEAGIHTETYSGVNILGGLEGMPEAAVGSQVFWPDPAGSTPLGFTLGADEMSEADLLQIAHGFVDAYRLGPGPRQPTEGPGDD
jgi:hypothetical protein